MCASLDSSLQSPGQGKDFGILFILSVVVRELQLVFGFVYTLLFSSTVPCAPPHPLHMHIICGMPALHILSHADDADHDSEVDDCIQSDIEQSIEV